MLAQLLGPAAATLEGVHIATESRIQWLRVAGLAVAALGVIYLATRVPKP